MSKININTAKVYFDIYVKLQRKAIADAAEDEKIVAKKLDCIDQKVVHTEEVVKDGTVVANILNFNESALSLQQIALLNHDIGRFRQMRYMGNYDDAKLKEANLFKVANHGELGRLVLEAGILKKQIPSTRVYDDIILDSVAAHVTNISKDEELSILLSDIFRNEDIADVLEKCDAMTKYNIFKVITQIVQDVDRLDIYHQILSDRWPPVKNDLVIDQKVFDMFYRGEYLNMSKLKEAGLWNANVGELVRLGFINQIKLLSVAKMILDEDLIMRMKNKRQNPMAKDAFEFQQHKLEEMIKNSQDGVTVSKVLVR